MRRTILAAVPLAVLALAAPAAAHGGKHATTYRAELAPVAAAPVALPSMKGGPRVVDVRGNAKLVDGSRRDKVGLHVKGLTAGESYTWSLRQVAPAAEAADDDPAAVDCAGEAVAAFEYQPLLARRHGHTKARARSQAFAAEEGVTYVLAVTAADGTDVACGEFRGKPPKR